MRRKSASRIRMLRRHRTFRHASILRRIIPIALAATAVTVRDRIMEPADATVAAEADGDAVGDAIAADASRAAQAVEICRRQNMLRHKVANIADTTIAIAADNSAAATIIAVKRGLAAPVLRPRTFRTRRFFSPANRLQNIATSPRPCRNLSLLLNRYHAKSHPRARRPLLTRRAICRLPLQAQPECHGVFRVACRVGFWRTLPRKRKSLRKHPRHKLKASRYR